MGSGHCAERRAQTRYMVNSDVFVVDAEKPGRLTDISLDGLAWRYIDRKHWPAGSARLGIVTEETNFFLRDIPFTVVSDQETEHDWPDRSLVIRRRGVRFGELTAEQLTRLAEFIKRYTAEQQLTAEPPPAFSSAVAF